MYFYAKKTKIILYAKTTLDYIRAFVNLRDYFDVVSVAFQQVPRTVKIQGITIQKIDDALANRHDEIVISVTRQSENWEEDAVFFEKNKMVFLKDFNFYFLISNNASIDMRVLGKLCEPNDLYGTVISTLAQNRKVVILNGNCQTNYLKLFLLDNQEFSSKYFMIDIPRIQLYKDLSDTPILKKILPFVDFCLSQPIAIDNKFSSSLSTQHLFSNLRETAEKITIPNITFLGYFPQYKKEQSNAITIGESRIFGYGDKFIDELFAKGYSSQEILRRIKSPSFLSEAFIDGFFEEQCAVSCSREAACDIKMWDFIAKRLRNEVCFYSFNHPNNWIIKELALRILKRLDVKNGEFDHVESLLASAQLRGQSELVYPCVAKHLNIEIPVNTKYFVNTNVINLELGFDDFVRVYINCFNPQQKVVDVDKNSV